MRSFQSLIVLFLLSSCSWFQSGEGRKQTTLKSTPSAEVTEFGPKRQKGGWFKDATQKYGLENVKAIRFYAVDFNNDQYTDLVTLASNAAEPEFYQFDPKKKKFNKILSPFNEGVRASFLLFYDFDRDQVVDVLVGFLNSKSELTKIPLRIFKGQLKNKKISFSEIKGAFTHAPESTVNISVLDYDADGFLDLFIANWYDFKDSTEPLPDRLLKGDKFKFTDVSYLLKDEWKVNKGGKIYPNAKPTFGSSTCDIDQNGFVDILTATSNGHSNKLWLNLYDFSNGERYFQDYAREAGYASDLNGFLDPVGGGNTYFSACHDYNNDEIMDVYVGELSHSYDPESKDRSSILTGSKKTFPPGFYRTEYSNDDESGKWDQGDQNGIWIDLNFDGYSDLLVDNTGFPPKSRLIFFMQESDHSFDDAGTRAGIDIVNPQGTIVMDINRDGKPDILTGQSNVRNQKIKPRVYLFENELPVKGKKILKVFLNGKRGNTLGVGATLTLETSKSGSKKIQKQFVEYSRGNFSSQREEGFYFGINQFEELSKLKITWPIRKDEKSSSIIERTYDLRKFKIKDLLVLTFCEDGRFLLGKKKCP